MSRAFFGGDPLTWYCRFNVQIRIRNQWMDEANECERKRGTGRSIGLILCGWVLALGWHAAVVGVRVGQVPGLDPWFCYSLTPVWAFCCFIAARGTYRVLSRSMRGPTLYMATVFAMLIQCFLFFFPAMLVFAYVHRWAGGYI